MKEVVKFGSWALLILLVFICFLLVTEPAEAQVPQAAKQYQRLVIQTARSVHGFDAPISLYAAQIEQESSWRPDVCSPFACGLTQQTDDNAQWLGTRYQDLRPANVFNPGWAVRALIHYNDFNHERVYEFQAGCQRWGATLACYNAGRGHVNRERIEAGRRGLDESVWFGSVDTVCLRKAEYCAETSHYAVAILIERQDKYLRWNDNHGGVCE